MITSIPEIKACIAEMLATQIPPLRTKGDASEQVFEGTKPAMQGKQKVDGYYFASIVEKPKDVRLYFFPIYTHASEFSLSLEASKALKGKSCFHIKKISPELEDELRAMIQEGIDLYIKDGLI